MADDNDARWTGEAEAMETLRREIQQADVASVARELRMYREVFARIDVEALLDATHTEAEGTEMMREAVLDVLPAALDAADIAARCSVVGKLGRNRRCRRDAADS